MSSEFKKLACKNIAFEVSSYFPDMSVCQILKRYGTLPTVDHEGTTETSPSSTAPRRSLASRLQEELEALPTSLTAAPTATSREAFTVSCDACTTTIRSCKEGTVLQAYMVVWAASALTVTVTPKLAATRLRAAHTEKDGPRSTPKSVQVELECHSLHIINKDVEERRRPGSYALQSIFQPRYPLLLECYPRHMIHLGLVTYALWHAPDELLAASPSPTTTKNVTPNGTGAAKQQSLLPSSEGDAVLVLGLGGNVIGRCLDQLLSPLVHLDTVEIEPAILQTCVEQHQVPPLTARTLGGPVGAKEATTAATVSASRKRTRSGTETTSRLTSATTGTDEPYVYWSADDEASSRKQEGTTASRAEAAFTATVSSEASGLHSQRAARYRFFRDDAYRFLREPALAAGPTTSATSSNPNYNMIFLDCYDPDREKMMFDEGLVSLCHKRLRPGGCLLVNAHVLPKRANLEGAFLFHQFATVQALRVAGCDQCLVACVRGDDEAHPVKAALEAKQRRFTQRNMATTAHHLNAVFLEDWQTHRASLASRPQGRRRTAAVTGEVSALSIPFHLDETWLHKNSIVSHMELEASGSSGKSGARIRQSDCRVWEHTT